MSDRKASLRQFWRSLVFWSSVARETLAGRSVPRLARCRLAGQRVEVGGLAHLPRSGVFTLASNHCSPGRTLDVLAALLSAAGQARRDLQDNYLLVVGRPWGVQPRPVRWTARPIAALARPMVRYFRRRWARHLLTLTPGAAPERYEGPTGSLQGSAADRQRSALAPLRAWRQRARRQPAIVFPEGVGHAYFEDIRPGGGRWLSGLPVPTVPAGVWPLPDGWHVEFGLPLQWAPRSDLRDVQLGLAIAALLPAELAPSWQEDLRRWWAVHQIDGDQLAADKSQVDR